MKFFKTLLGNQSELNLKVYNEEFSDLYNNPNIKWVFLARAMSLSLALGQQELKNWQEEVIWDAVKNIIFSKAEIEFNLIFHILFWCFIVPVFAKYCDAENFKSCIYLHEYIIILGFYKIN